MAIDFTTNVGKVRLRVADTSDLAFLPDSVYSSTLVDNNNNLPRTAKIIATYILGMLAFRTHRKLSNIEVWGKESFDSYERFLILTCTNPNFFDLSPIPVDMSGPTLHPLLQFQKDWNLNYSITQSQQLNWDAYGNAGNFNGNWQWPG